MSHKRYQVFKEDSHTVSHYAHAKLALEWVARGLAVVVGDRQIRMVKSDREVVRTSDAMTTSGQRKAYELAAIEPYCNFVQGGGVNGKRRQLTYKPFSAAHIGHQP